jgi:prepilin-type N-terminal cleavage/methylation domain-containing protein/prepilin-type processing-associated H-X9-DG protein
MLHSSRSRAFSMTELLVVIAVIVILMSLLIVTVNGVYAQAGRLKCQHRLEQIWHACRMFENQHGQLPQAYNPKTFVRWYDALVGGEFVTDRDFITCPAADTVTWAGGEGGSTPVTESELPVLLYNTGCGRSPNTWTDWGTYATLRQWLHDNLPYDIMVPQADTTSLVPLSEQMLSACSQVWFLNTEHYEYNRGGNVFGPDEVTAIHDFHARGGGFMSWSESYRQDDYYRSTNNMLEACGDVGLEAGPIGWSGGLTWQITPSDHPAMSYEGTAVTDMKSAYSPAKFTVVDNDPCARIIGACRIIDGGQVVAEGVPLIAAWDNGTGRILLQGSYTSLISYGGWPYGQIQEFCLASDLWLRRSGGLRAEGRCTYGYNNQVGAGRMTPGADTIVIMDYNDWEIDRDSSDPAKNDDDSYIATRHDGRANAVLADGRVEALRLGDIRAGMWTPGHD